MFAKLLPVAALLAGRARHSTSARAALAGTSDAAALFGGFRAGRQPAGRAGDREAQAYAVTGEKGARVFVRSSRKSWTRPSSIEPAISAALRREADLLTARRAGAIMSPLPRALNASGI